jgi:hypothetical protein
MLCACGEKILCKGLCSRCYYRAYHKDRNPALREHQKQLDAINPIRKTYRRMKSKYGLTPDQYEAIIRNGCEICHCRDNVVIDHNHKTGAVRGGLCEHCNLALGVIEKPNRWLERALSYLQRTSDGFIRKTTWEKVELLHNGSLTAYRHNSLELIGGSSETRLSTIRVIESLQAMGISMMSPNGVRVACMIEAWIGILKLPRHELSCIDWTKDIIDMTVHLPVSALEHGLLTRLVFVSHDHEVSVSVVGLHDNEIRMLIKPRTDTAPLQLEAVVRKWRSYVERQAIIKANNHPFPPSKPFIPVATRLSLVKDGIDNTEHENDSQSYK